MSGRDGNMRATPRCAGEPVSWLALERYRLNELPASGRRAIEDHLTVCTACAACLEEIDRSLALPPLPPAPQPVAWWTRLRAAWHRAGSARVWAPAGAAGIALVLAVFLFVRPHPLDDTLADGTLPGIKGGAVALSLVRERNGSIDHDAVTFTDGDRWKALVTCPTARVAFWDVVVADGDTKTFPLVPSAPITCGNQVPLPGAFRLSGNRPIDVCLLLATDPIERGRFTGAGAGSPGLTPSQIAGARITCVTLRPEP